jgi:hypothetical protein
MATIQGTSAHNDLSATSGDDVVEGFGGNDHLRGVAGNDILRGGDGFDVLIAEGGNDTLDGGAHDDWFYGSVGNDRLTGGPGADRFVFETGLNASTNVDTITDFTPGTDKIWLNASTFTKLNVNGALNPSMLRIGSAAADANDFIIYNPDNGALSYDSNGNASGGMVQFASLARGLNLTGGDFNIFGASQSAPAPTTPPPTPTPDTGTSKPDPVSSPTTAKLTKTTNTVRSTRDGQVIENLDIWVDNGHGIQVTHDNVIIRNVRIHHKEGNGIYVSGARNVTIEKSEVINSSPPSGINPETSSKLSNIETLNSPDITIRNVTVRDGSSGIYLVDSPNADLQHVDGYNFHGPMPRGQFVQFNRSGNSTLTDFYVHNDRGNSHPEDNVSVYASPNVRISNGVIDGNNSVTGVGIMFEAGSSGGRVKNVDAIHMGNGAFSSYVGDVVFDDTRTFDSIYGDQGRGMSASKGVHFGIASYGVSILNSTYTHPGNPGNIAWDRSKAAAYNVREDAGATPMAHIVNDFDWIV